MFDTLPGTHARAPRGRAKALIAAFTVHAMLLSGLGVSSLFAVEPIQAPLGAGRYVLHIALPPPPSEPLGEVRKPAAPERPDPAPDQNKPAEVTPAPEVQPNKVPDAIIEPSPQTSELDPSTLNASIGSPTGSRDGVIGGANGGAGQSPVAPDPPAARIHRVGGDVVPPRLIHQEMPRYTKVMRHTRLEGEVVVEAVIDELGRVVDLRVVQSPHRLLSEAATLAMREWRFESGRLNGRPVPVYFQLRVRFTLR